MCPEHWDPSTSRQEGEVWSGSTQVWTLGHTETRGPGASSLDGLASKWVDQVDEGMGAPHSKMMAATNG